MGWVTRFLGLVTEPYPPTRDMRPEVYAAGRRLIDAMYAFDGYALMYDECVNDKPKAWRKGRKRAWLEMMTAQNELHVALATVYFHGWSFEDHRRMPDKEQP